MIAGFRAVTLLLGMGGLLTTSMSIFAVVYGQSAFKVRWFENAFFASTLYGVLH